MLCFLDVFEKHFLRSVAPAFAACTTKSAEKVTAASTHSFKKVKDILQECGNGSNYTCVMNISLKHLRFRILTELMKAYCMCYRTRTHPRNEVLGPPT